MMRGELVKVTFIGLALLLSVQSTYAGPPALLLQRAKALKEAEGAWNLTARKKFLSGLGKLGKSSDSIPRRGKTLILSLAGPRSTDTAMIPFAELQSLYGKDSVKFLRAGEDPDLIASWIGSHDTTHVMGHGLGGEWMGPHGGPVVDNRFFQTPAIQRASRGKIFIFDGCATAWTHSPEGILNTNSLFYSATVHADAAAVVGLMGRTSPEGNRMFLRGLLNNPGRIPLVGHGVPEEIRAFNDFFRAYNGVDVDALDVVENNLFRPSLR